ncbi:uncharacterized protein FIBRA_01387 [Fibroporia radiculosa]|uniref:Uncharacterized protein n=1 Tax=Fibroporia radiculosa TaxID=599839 RepID=J4H133_9APHY|nr:uncharacterized protein FIBRA_01387 [Fibroporia radiculosa]CCL99369.1 predicted protein [Fibroporia radiculosa]
MCEFLSLSVLQILSVLSFFTSILAVLHVGTGSLHRLSNKFDTESAPSQIHLNVGKQQPWHWSSLPASLSLASLLGDESKDQMLEKGSSNPLDLQQPPLSMAKIIMSRHVITPEAASSPSPRTGDDSVDVFVTTR